MNTNENAGSTGGGQPTRRWTWVRPLLRVLLCLVAVLATMLVVFYSVENWRGGRAWRAAERKLQSQGAPLELAKLVPPAVPADQNFAMTPFFAPLFDFLPGTQQARDTNAVAKTMEWAKNLPGFNPKWRLGKRTDLGEWLNELENKEIRGGPDRPFVPGNPGDPATARAVLEKLRAFDPVLEELRKASSRPHSRFGIRYDYHDPTAILLPHLSRIRLANRLLVVRASALLALDRPDAALDDLALSLYVSDAVRTEPCLISQIVRGVNLPASLQVVWDGLAEHRWNDAQLQQILALLKDRDPMKDLQFAFQVERAWGNSIIMKAKQDSAYLARLGGTPDAGMAEQMYPDVFETLLSWIPRGWLDFEQVNYNRIFEDLAGAETSAPRRVIPPAENKRKSEELARELTGDRNRFFGHKILAGILLPELPNIVLRFATYQNALDEALLAVALERYRLKEGKYPAALEELSPGLLPVIPRDVTTGGALRYGVKDNRSFVLYSPGWDGQDGGGVAAREVRNKEWDPRDGDWVWGYGGGTGRATP